MHSTTLSFATAAARNNALWCDAVCATHGNAGTMGEDYWQSAGPPPRFYPNLVTLREGSAAASVQMAAIEQAIGSPAADRWGVKDSFHSLDLTPLGFSRLLEAHWLWRPPSQPAPTAPDGELAWARVQSDCELTAWEQAWRGNGAPTPEARVFLAPLLNLAGIDVIAASKNGQIVGGAIAFHAAGVVGLSNVFVPPEDPQRFWSEGVAMISRLRPALPLVGYEQGEHLAWAKGAGFEVLRPLAVWSRRT